MVLELIRLINKNKRYSYAVCFILIFTLLCVFNHTYLLWQSQHIVGLVLLLFTVDFRDQKESIPLTFFIIQIVLTALQLYSPATTFSYLICVNTLLALTWRFELNSYIPYALLIINSPVFYYIKNTLGLPLRFTLTNLSAKLLELIGQSIAVKGNWIYCNNDVFSIDEACAGLNSITYALLFCVFILISIEKKHPNYRFTLLQLISYLTLMIGLVVLGNFFRICVLILFKIGPELAMHNIIGIVYLCLSCTLFYFISLRITPSNSTIKTPKFDTTIAIFFTTTLLSILLTPKTQINKIPRYLINNALTTKVLKDGTTQLSNNTLLIYAKPIKSPFSAEHSPLLCWKSSGYHIDQIEIIDNKNFKYFKAKLKRDKESLTTIWWFESNKHQTLDQWEWRKEALLNPGSLNLINITSANESDILNFIDDSILIP